jgi:hypothetical protein
MVANWKGNAIFAIAIFILSLYQLVLEVIGRSLWMNWYHIRMSIILLIMGWVTLIIFMGRKND